jgi:hypothetical protein
MSVWLDRAGEKFHRFPRVWVAGSAVLFFEFSGGATPGCYFTAGSDFTFAHLARAAAAIPVRPAALIFLRFFTGSCWTSGVADALALAHRAFMAATFFARPVALNLYFFLVPAGLDSGNVTGVPAGSLPPSRAVS